MSKLFFCLFLFLFGSLVTFGQIGKVYESAPFDSTVITFESRPSSSIIGDTATAPLWQVGHGHKAFFGDDSLTQTMMTDTLLPYPRNANNFFIVKIKPIYNVIVDFWHKYQTDTGRDGGIVEFSLDTGLTWQNVKGECNIDSGIGWKGVYTENLYTFNDTLQTGEPAFTGTQSSTLLSRVQFFLGWPQKTTQKPLCNLWSDLIYLRFRFVSDTTVDTLAGWEIDSIKIENDNYGGGGVRELAHQQALKVFPNPSCTGVFYFPSLINEDDRRIQVYDAIGRRILEMQYSHKLDIGQYPKGLYYYKVSDGTEYYCGQLRVE